MKKKCIILIMLVIFVILLGTTVVNADALEKTKCVTFDDDFLLEDQVMLDSDTYIAVGNEKGESGRASEPRVIKYKVDGTICWKKEILGGTYGDDLYSVIKTADNAIITVGWSYTYNGTAWLYDGIIAKYSITDGEELWKTTKSNITYYKVIEGNDGKYVALGKDKNGKWFLDTYDSEGNFCERIALKPELSTEFREFCDLIKTEDGYTVVGIKNHTIDDYFGTYSC